MPPTLLNTYFIFPMHTRTLWFASTVQYLMRALVSCNHNRTWSLIQRWNSNNIRTYVRYRVFNTIWLYLSCALILVRTCGTLYILPLFFEYKKLQIIKGTIPYRTIVDYDDYCTVQLVLVVCIINCWVTYLVPVHVSKKLFCTLFNDTTLNSFVMYIPHNIDDVHTHKVLEFVIREEK